MQNPTPPKAPTAPTVPQYVANGVPGSPAVVLRGLKAQRHELADQLEKLQDRRNDLAEKLQDPMVGGANRKGLEQRITDIDARIASVDKQIAAADAEVAQASAIPGAVVEPPPIRNEGPPEEAWVLGGMFMVVVLLPLSIAYARRIWRRSSAAIAELPHEVMDRLVRLDHAVDSIAVEVERIGEGQRFVTRLMSERAAPDALLAAERKER